MGKPVVQELTDAQRTSVGQLLAALDGLGNALIACRDNGLEPSEAFTAAGISIPSFAAPMLNMMLQHMPKSDSDAAVAAGNDG